VKKRFNHLEIAIRIKSPTGTLLSEHIIRDQTVELINYFPSGVIWQHMKDVPLERFTAELTKVLADASN
jgi:hypothetical protein